MNSKSLSYQFNKHYQLLFVLALYTLVILTGSSNMLINQGEHAAMMNNLLEGSGGEVDYNFLVSLKIYNFFQYLGIAPTTLAIIVGYIVILFTFKEKLAVKNGDFLILLFCFSPALFMNLGKPSKEMFITLFMIFCVGSLNKGKIKKASLIVFVYAAIFRIYYIPLAISLYLFSLKSVVLKWLVVIFGFISVLLFFLFFDEKIFDFISGLLSRRDYGYLNDDNIRRTVFANPFDNDSWFNIILNYFNAMLRLNLSLIYSFTLKEFFLQAYVFYIFYISICAYRRGSSLGAAVLVNMMVYPLFEPDLGSYLRHIASIFPLYFYLHKYVSKPKLGKLC
ncbi:hypothetical protein [Pseudoalteromonas gelatinilytica]|uniref:hypothetical protein n=1 Tax=Pseudoalteromonas gelatinilytica TaxID=1703256 RepID=UPI0007C46A89|nr:hypothetical protein [Pseudoalteromonas gelatinilytica]